MADVNGGYGNEGAWAMGPAPSKVLALHGTGLHGRAGFQENKNECAQSLEDCLQYW